MVFSTESSDVHIKLYMPVRKFYIHGILPVGESRRNKCQKKLMSAPSNEQTADDYSG